MLCAAAVRRRPKANVEDLSIVLGGLSGLSALSRPRLPSLVTERLNRASVLLLRFALCGRAEREAVKGNAKRLGQKSSRSHSCRIELP